jgi:hypothetical protein
MHTIVGHICVALTGFLHVTSLHTAIKLGYRLLEPDLACGGVQYCDVKLGGSPPDRMLAFPSEKTCCAME